MKFIVYRLLIFFCLLILPYSLMAISENPVPDSIRLNQDNNLKLLTWNIYMLPHCSLIKGNCKRARKIAEEIKSYNVDIIVFEEAFDYRARGILKRHLKKVFPFMYGPANTSLLPLKTSSGLWIVSKVPLVKIKEIEYQSRYGIDAMAKKGAVMFQGVWKGYEFQLIGTHLQADSPDEIRRNQCAEISEKLLQKYYKPHIPQFVCGDFNIEQEDSLNYHFMLNTLKAENGNLEGNQVASYDEIDNALAKRINGKKKLIDYILVRNSQIVVRIQRKISVFKGKTKHLAVDLSDHYAVEASIDFGNYREISLQSSK